MRHAGNGGDAVDQPAIEKDAVGGIGAHAGDVHVDDQDAIAVEAERHVRKPLERTDEEARRGDQDERERHLGDDEAARQIRPAAPVPALLHRVDRFHPARAERWSNAEQQDGRHRDGGRERRDAPVEREIEKDPRDRRGDLRRDRAAAPDGD